MSLFNFRGDRYVVELTIEFDLTAIYKWLKTGATEKTGKDYWETIDKSEKDVWTDARQYHIDVLPNGQSRDMYFHRKKSIISNEINGFEINSDNSKWSFPNIEMLEWSYWNSFLCLKANKKSVLLAPLNKFAELQAFGRLKNATKYGEAEKIKAPVRFHPKSNQPIEFIEIFRTEIHPRCVGYENALASVHAQTSGFMGQTIEY
jgi:hypothetical protein